MWGFSGSAARAPIVAVVLGHVSLSQIKKEPQKGKGFAIAGLILGYLGVVAIVLLIVALAVGSKKASDEINSRGSIKNGVSSISGNKKHPPKTT